MLESEKCPNRENISLHRKKQIGMIRTEICCGLAAVALLAGCGQKPDVNVSQSYDLLELKPESRTLTVSYSSRIEGRQDIAIYPQVSGFITDLLVEEGQKVKKNQPLFIIDQVNYEAALNTAKANVEVAEAALATASLTYDSKKELYKHKVISEFELSTAENSYLSAKAQLAQMQAQEISAENNLSYTVVKAPADGVIGTLPYRVGALVSSAMASPLTTVSDNSDMYVYFSMTENKLIDLIRKYGSKDAAIKSMPEVVLELNDNSVYSHKGKIETISGVIDRNTGSVSVKAVFPNPEGLLHSGGSGNVVIPDVRKDCIVIPTAATFELQDKVFAYKVVDGKATAVPITVTKAGSTEYIVDSGLEFGDVIVAKGAGLMREGTVVMPSQNAVKGGAADEAVSSENE